MISEDQDFREFIEKIKNEDFNNFEEFKGICWLEKKSNEPSKYADLVGGFLYFCEHGGLDPHLSKENFQLFRTGVEELVKKGLVVPERLNFFQ